MVGEHLRVILAAGRATRSTPPPRRCFSARSRARDLPVGDVADEQRAGTRTRLAGDRERRARGGRTPSARARAAAPRPRRVGAASRALRARRPCRPRRRPGAAPSPPAERVEPGGDDPLHRLGQRHLRAGRARASIRDVLLGVERVAARAREQRRLRRRRRAPRCSSSAREEPRRLLVGERRERERRARSPCRRPSRAGASSSSGRAVQTTSSGTPRRPVDQVVDEVEQAVVRPVEVLEDEHERPLARPAPRRSAARRRTPRRAGRRALRRRAGRRAAEVRLDPVGLGRRRTSVVDASRELLASASSASSVSRIPACAFTISPSAQKRDALAVRQASGPGARRSESGSPLDARRARRRAGSCRSPARRRA